MAEPEKPKPTDASLAAKILRLRTEADLTVAQAAALAGLETALWVAIEQNRAMLTVAGLYPIALALGVRPQELLE